jgi:hypothetical protein
MIFLYDGSNLAETDVVKVLSNISLLKCMFLKLFYFTLLGTFFECQNKVLSFSLKMLATSIKIRHQYF